MQSAPERSLTLGLDQNLLRLNGIIARSFPVQDVEQATLSTKLAAEDSSQSHPEEKEVDWSITLSSIREISKQVRASEARAEAAEARAVRAEERAVKAEHWLRTLHKILSDEASTQEVV